MTDRSTEDAARARRRLGVAEDAELSEVRQAYRELARRNHPDRFADAPPAERALAQHRMQEINDAWQRVRRPPSSVPRSARSSPSRAPSRPPFPEAVEYQPGMPPLIKYGPWVFLLMLLGVIFVATAFAGTRGDGESAGRNASGVPSASVGSPAEGAVAAETSDPIRSGTQPAAPDVRSIVGDCVRIVDAVVTDELPCTPEADGVLEPAADANGNCQVGSQPVFHPEVQLGMCLRPMAGNR